jgi:hypothetical protein
MAIYSDCNKYTSMLDYLINWNLWKNRLRRGYNIKYNNI